MARIAGVDIPSNKAGEISIFMYQASDIRTKNSTSTRNLKTDTERP